MRSRTSTGRAFTTAVLRWYANHGRRLPWRGIRNPYRILVSEIMLQQTQVSRVLQKYPLFLRAFPTLQALASAPRASVVRTWQGMGYNNRAVRLHLLAGIVMDRHDGRLPRDYESLAALPGIGRYTACAILSSAFDAKCPVVDVNIRRLFSRVFWRMQSYNGMQPESDIWPLAAECIPHHAAYAWNQALMDLGATICTARSPRCAECPLKRFCNSRTHMRHHRTPQRSAEPSYRGTPIRIHRGRIVETLRRVPEGGWMRLETLAEHVFKSQTKNDLRRIGDLVAQLEQEGLVKSQRRRVALR